MLRRKLFSLALVLTLALVLLSVNVFAAEDAPELVDGYYEIYTADQLYWFAEQVNGGSTSINGKLMADIVVNENVLNADGTLNGDGSNFRVWTPINGYAGAFDGAQHTISGLFVNTPNANNVGMFGLTQHSSRIKNLGVVDSYFVGNSDVGSIVGFSGVRRYWEADDFDDWSYAYYVYSLIENCFSTATVSGEEYVGGLVGLHGGELSNSYFAGRVLKGANVGAIIGKTHDIRSDVLIPEDYDPGSVPEANNCFYLSTCVSVGSSHGTAMTAEQFASGEVAYLLQGGQTEQVWGQAIGTNPYPVLGGPEVKYDQGEYYNENLSEVPILVNGYYEIYTIEQLYWFAAQVNSGNTSINGKLMADIVVNENVLNSDGTLNGDGSNFRVWTPIGNGSKKYTGTFEGNGKTVSGLYFNDTATSYVGLVGYLEDGAVQNVGVVASYLSGSYYIGGVVGKNSDGTISNCYNTGSVSGIIRVGGVVGENEYTVSDSYNSGRIIGSNELIGGVVGYNFGEVINCYNTASVSGGDYVGGLVGYNYISAVVQNCYNIGSVSGNESVGGVVGFNYSTGVVQNCYNTGSVSGSNYVGGVVGYNSGTVRNSYNTGSVSGSNYVGGVVGYNSGTVRNSYNTGSVSGSKYVGGVVSYHIINLAESDNKVASCYNTGKVSAGLYRGGVVGYECIYYDDGLDGDEIIPDSYTTLRNCYYLSGCVSNGNSYGSAMTAEQFASGEVAYLLQGSQTEQVWGQTIGSNPYPVLGGPEVKYDHGDYYNENLSEVPILVNGYYEIFTADQLYWFAAQVNSGNTSINGKLMADIVVNENVLNSDGTLNGDGSNFRAWTPIGNYEKIYTGTFEGNGKTVSGLYVNDTTKDCLGLIGYVGAGGLLQNVGVVDSYLQGDDYVGGVVGENHGSVTNCYHTGCVMGDSLVGGVLGYNDGTVSGCYNTGAVIGSTYNIGGVAGRNYVGTISDCYNSGSVTSSNYNVGGIVGYNDGTVTNSYNVGNVSSSRFNVGGVAGRNYGGTITNCYNTGSVTGSYSVGGVAAKSFDGEISNCYNIGIINGDYDIGGVIGCVDNGNDVTVNCYYLSNCVSGGSSYGTAVTAEQLASGQVAYLLGQAFGQTIGTDTAPILNGKEVYQNQIGGCCADSFAYDYSNTQADAVTTHSWVEATCTAPKTCADCGATLGNALGHGTLTYSFDNNTHILTCDVCGEPALTKNSTDGKQFKFNTASPALSVDIVMNIAVTLPAGFSEPSMVIEFNGKTTTLTEYTVNATNGRYEYAFPGINPQTMGDTFHATLYAAVDGVQVSVELDYSMMKYINSQLKKDISAELRTALSDLVMYGEANQVYEGYKTDALLSTLLEATATLTPSTFSELDGSFYKQATSGTKDANIDLKGVTVALGSKVAVRMTLQCTEAAAYSVKVNLHGVDYVWAVSDLALAEGYTDRYAVEFDQIKATQFDEIITFSFLDADGNQVGRTLEYTVYSYVQRNQDNPDEALAKLLQAIYSYGESVKKI